MYVTITLNSGLGADLGPNFNLTADVGSVTPSTATRSELLAGKLVDVDASATQVTVTSTGACTTSININISGQTTTTTTAAPAQFTIGYDAANPFISCTNRTIDPRIVYAANGAVLANGVALYYDQQLTTPVNLGFYSDGTNWFRVTGVLGVISSNGSCATTSTTTTTGAPTTTTSTSTSTSTTTAGPTSTTTTTQAPATFSLRYSTISGGDACYQSATTYYAENGSLLGDGTVIYTNGSLTTLAPAGWYSDGTNYWYVSPTCFEYDVTNGGASAVNIQFRDCDDVVTLLTIAAGATENVCAKQFDELNGCTTVNKGVGICLITTDGTLSLETACPGTTTSTSTSTSTSTTSTSTSTSTTSTSTSTSTTLPPTTSTSTSTSTSTTSTSTTSTTTGGPTTTSTTSTTTQPGSTTTSTSTTSTSTTTAAPTTTSTSTTTAAPTTTSTSTTSTSTTTAGPGLSVAQSTVTCTNDTGAFTSTASGGTGTYDWIAIASTQANAISYVNGVGGTRYAMSTNPYNWSGIGNGTWYIAVKDSSGATAYGTVVVACSTTSTTSTSTSTTSTSTSTTTTAAVYSYSIWTLSDNTSPYDGADSHTNACTFLTNASLGLEVTVYSTSATFQNGMTLFTDISLNTSFVASAAPNNYFRYDTNSFRYSTSVTELSVCGVGTTTTTSTTTTTTTAAPQCTYDGLTIVCDAGTTTSTSTTTTVAPTTTTTTAAINYVSYPADKYTCGSPSCGAFVEATEIAFPDTFTPVINKWYSTLDANGYAYQLTSTTPSAGPGLVMYAGTFNTCEFACVI